MKRNCKHPQCNKLLKGRADQKFCSVYCKTDFHYQKRKSSGKEYFKKKIDDIIRKNRQILTEYNLAGKTIVRKRELLNKGFNPKCFTHYWKKQNGESYLFCYDQGFKQVKDNGKDKYLLIQWQEYMDKQIFN